MKHTITAAMLDALKDADKVEQIWLAEFQRINGPDVALSAEAQGKLNQLRQHRYNLIARAEGLP